MTDGIIPHASLFLGIIPALFILYFALKNYEGYFKEKNIFLTFVIGIIIGFFAAMVRILVPLAWLNIIIYAIFEQLFKTVFLNLRRFHGEKGNTIYGLCLGLGFGAIFTPFLIISIGSLISDWYMFLLIIIGGIGFILFHGATGAYLGYGIYSGKLRNYLIIAILLQLPFNSIVYATRYLFETEYFSYLQIGLVVYGGIIFGYVFMKIMPKILSRSKKKKKSNR